MPNTASANIIQNRYEFVLFFDVQDGNPNGDPDAGNAPRIDAETGQGLVTDVCLKRKVRNYIQLTQPQDGDIAGGYEIYVKQGTTLAGQQKRAYDAKGLQPAKKAPTPTVKDARAWMCKTFYDVRAFGAVMSTGKVGDEDEESKAKKTETGGRAGKQKVSSGKLWNCGQVRGPIQLSFSRSIERIFAQEHAITRIALTNASDVKGSDDDDDMESRSGQFGRKSTIPYALYRCHGFVSPFLARDTGFSAADLDLFWQSLINMFEHDRSASRGVMSARKLIVFEHDSALGNAPSHKLFDRVTCARSKSEGSVSKKPARVFEDYVVTIDDAKIDGVTVRSMI